MATEVAQPPKGAEPTPATPAEVDGGDAIDWGKKKTKKKAAAKAAEPKAEEATTAPAEKKSEEKPKQ